MAEDCGDTYGQEKKHHLTKVLRSRWHVSGSEMMHDFFLVAQAKGTQCGW